MQWSPEEQLRRNVELAALMTFVTDAFGGSSIAQPPLETRNASHIGLRVRRGTGVSLR